MRLDVEVPTFTLPPGVRRVGAGASFGPDDNSSRTRLETKLTLDELVAHFLPQLAQAGWKIEGGPTSDGTMSMTRLSGASRTGEPVTAQLIITMLPGTPYADLMARFIRH
jgi:hypothetical protein